MKTKIEAIIVAALKKAKHCFVVERARAGMISRTFVTLFMGLTCVWKPAFAQDSTQPGFETTLEIRDEADQHEDSAQSVQVIQTTTARRRPADLGSVLARERGVALRRFGGLGSPSRISIDGLSGAQVPVLVDGIPVEFSAFSSDPSAIPTSLVQRLEIYRGVVPARFGADALGAAVNVKLSGDQQASGFSASYQIGSFDTHRLSAQSHLRLGRSLFTKVYGFLDRTRNDYLIPVELGQKDGSILSRRVHRSNANYLGYGGGLTLGMLKRAWADELSVSAFYSQSKRGLPHNIVMTVPYGRPFIEQRQPGFRARYTKSWRQWTFQLDAAGTARRLTFVDRDNCVYDWLGQCLLNKSVDGEILGRPIDQTIHQPGGLARAKLDTQWGKHQLGLVSTLTAFSRRGRNRLADPLERDPAKARHRLFRWISGLEYQWTGLQDRLHNIAFVKSYGQWLRSKPPALGNNTPPEVRANQGTFGFGDSLRFRATNSVLLKLAYEWTTRLAGVDEIFGDGSRHVANLELLPERSHNVNLEFHWRDSFRAGSFSVDSTLAFRDLSQAIAQIPSQNTIRSQNVVRARAYSADLGIQWSVPSQWLSIGLNASWIDFRNRAKEGPFTRFAGDRMPAQPWLRANAHLGLRWLSPFSERDEITFDLRGRYVHPFFRGWESAGSTAFKQRIPEQWVLDADLVYQTFLGHRNVSVALGVYNILDKTAYDYVGVALVSRSVQSKFSIAL